MNLYIAINKTANGSNRKLEQIEVSSSCSHSSLVDYRRQTILAKSYPMDFSVNNLTMIPCYI